METLNSNTILEQSIIDINNFLFQKTGEKRNIEKELSKLNAELEKTEDIILLKSKVRELLINVGKYARQESKKTLESMVSSGLRFVFKEDIQFEIEIKQHQKNTEAEFYIINNYEGNKIRTKPEDSRGGGLIDVVSVMLRIAIMESFNISGPLVLDEPAKHLSKKYIPAFAEFLKQTAKKFGRQIIMITHNDELASCGDIIYLVKKEGGISKVIEISQ